MIGAIRVALAFFFKRISALGCLIIICALSNARAEDVPTTTNSSATPNPTIEEVTVTAQRREENAQQVPIAITALSNGDLEQKEVLSVIDLAQFAPGMDAK